MKKQIERIVQQTIDESGLTYYREPLYGYAAADDPLFIKFREVVGPRHFLPVDLLPGARTVLAFFLPFRRQITAQNRAGAWASREWAEVYIATNKLIVQIGAALRETLGAAGVTFIAQPPTYEFDRELLISNWSHRHVAYACGLGSFGRNHLLITARGSGGRFGSGVIDAAVEPTVRSPRIHYCLADSRGCRYCEKVCPAGALTPSGFDRRRCYRQCLKNDRHYRDLELTDVCGKCLTGPCSYLENGLI